jgi:hypothetical protein
MGKIERIEVPPENREPLVRLVRDRNTPQRIVWRSQIALLAGTRKRIRRGVFKSVDELKQAIMDYLDKHNGHPKPYVWTKTAAENFTKVARAKQALESQH